MKLSTLAGSSILPLLARLVLCAAFIPAGFSKVFSEKTVFEGEDAAILTRLGVGDPIGAVTAHGGPAGIRLASWQDEDPPADPAVEAAADPQAGAGAEPGPEPGAKPEASPEPVTQDPPAIEPGDASAAAPIATTVEAKSLHHVTLLLVKGHWPETWMPQYMAWVAALTELVGGVLLLFGLFSRMWGLGLAIAMGFAFYLTSWPTFEVAKMLSLVTEDQASFNRMFCQLGLLVLALGIFFTGPGPVSLDRMLFKRSGSRDDLDDDES